MPSFAHARLAAMLAAALIATACSTTGSRQPLYQQLGGEAGIDAVASRLIDRVSTDPRTSRSFGKMKIGFLKKSVAAYLCKVADGPCTYEGETMLNAHKDLKNTGAEFDLMVQMLREELDAAGVGTAAKNELLRRLAPSRRDIVTGTS